MKLILGSESKKRKLLLEEAGIHIDEVLPAHVDEKSLRSEDFFELPKILARAKRDALLPQIQEPSFLITGDTVLFSEDILLEKPESADEERYFFSLYDGVRPFSFVTALTVTNTATGESVEGAEEGQALSGPYTKEFVEEYIKKGEYMYYAGGFTHHDPIFHNKFKFISGSAGALIGMPIELVKELLAKVGYKS